VCGSVCIARCGAGYLLLLVGLSERYHLSNFESTMAIPLGKWSPSRISPNSETSPGPAMFQDARTPPPGRSKPSVSPSSSLTSDQRLASSRPASILTRRRTGIGRASITRRKRKPRRIFPVKSAIKPTMSGPRKEADLSVRAKSEKKEDSWPCFVSNTHNQE
jgi:hypothetical protein